MNELANLIWVGVCIPLVFIMLIGFSLLECGLCRAKNAVNVMMKNFVGIAITGLAFTVLGYGLFAGTSLGGWLGGMDVWIADIKGLDAMNMVYQIMFASCATAIVSGALSERMRYTSFLISAAVMAALIYPVFAHWAWHPQGWLKELGFIDLAGTSAVHSIGAWCALAGVIALGPRMGRFSKQGEIREIPGHNLPMVALGSMLLWFGWFGFNGGSIGSLEGANLGRVLLNTHLGGCAGVLGGLLFMKLTNRKIYLTAMVNAGLAGLVSITGGAATMSPLMAAIAGFIGGIACIVGGEILRRMHFDDVVDAVAVHGIGGMWGTLASGMFYMNDMFNGERIAYQIVGIGVAFMWSFLVSIVVFKLVDKFMGLRSDSLHEQRGLDYTEHHELGYPEFQNTPGQLKKEG